MNNKYLLTLDIGGSNPRLAMMEILSENNFKILKTTDAKSDSNSIIPIINNFLEECSKIGYTTNTVVISVAGPIENNSCNHPTNAKFRIIDKEIIENSHLSNVLVINDFAAIGEAICTIENPTIDSRLKPIINVAFNPNGHRAIIGPGTGLGVAYLTKTPYGYFVHESEGGHAGFSVFGNFDRLFKFLQKKLHTNQIGTESLVSGQGIRNITEFLIENPNAIFDILKDDPLLNDILTIEHNINPTLSNLEILTAIRSEKTNQIKIDAAKYIAENIRNNPNANIAMRLFTTFLGNAAQNVALHGSATGGLFIAGGIASKNLHLFENNDFEKAFYDNWKENIRDDLLKKIPIYIITDYDISFYGCARAGVLKFTNSIK